MSPRNASMKNWAKSRGGFPASAARRMITSSMSVKFCTKTTRFPRNSRYRRATSNAMYERAWPRWLKSYVVGPQTYIFTTPGVRGTNGSFRRVRVLYNRSAMTDANAATGPALLRPWPVVDGPLSPRRNLAIRRNLYAASRCARPRGPIDQRKIAAFARRKPWVQIPLGPLRPALRPSLSIGEEKGRPGGDEEGSLEARSEAPSSNRGHQYEMPR